MKVQWNPVDSDTKGTCHSVRIIAGCPKKSHGYDTSFLTESKKLKKWSLSKSREKTFRGPQYFFTGRTPEDRRTDQNTETSNTSPSSETQGQIVGARESLNGRKNKARRKVKNSEKSPWGQCLNRPVPNGRRRSGIWLVPENFCVFLPN